MYIPLNRLYHFIENIANETYGDSVIIYRFWPNGAKNIEHLNFLPTYRKSWFDSMIRPLVWCNDQEPLQHEYYKTNLRTHNRPQTDIQKKLNIFVPPLNLNYIRNIFKKNILVHSENVHRMLKNILPMMS